MNPLFADTFYWIALVDFTDSFHQRALALTSERSDSLTITTDEVLAEYLTFFATAPEPMRRKAVINARRILEERGVEVIPQSRESFGIGRGRAGGGTTEVEHGSSDVARVLREDRQACEIGGGSDV